MLEIEYKYLLKHLPWSFRENYDEVIVIEQCYWMNPETCIWERGRKAASGKVTKYYHTIKTKLEDAGAPTVFREIENEIAFQDFADFLRKSTRIIIKTRYVKHAEDGLKWGMDAYEGMSLITAEIEVPTSGHELITPEWIKDLIILDISKYEEFSNRSLSRVIPKIGA